MVTIIGLGPGSLERVPGPVRDLLLDPARTVVARTVHHPAAAELAGRRSVIFCDDLYDRSESFADVYTEITNRVLDAGDDVIYAVPGSPTVGEFAVRKIVERAPDTVVIPGESFVDAILATIGYDPLDRGLQILNGHEIPDPLVLDKPTIVAHLDTRETLGDVLDAVARVVHGDAEATLIVDVGSSDANVVTAPVDELEANLAGLRTSLFIDVEPGGLVGAVHTMRKLREQCPWDRDQTHQSLVKNLIEETYELVEAIGDLPDGDTDWVAYAAVEDELGDVLLQVLFHEAIARETGATDIDGVAEVLRQKLVRRHPHVFGDVDAEDAEQVKKNWDEIKATEEGRAASESILDGVPSGLPALQKSSKLQNRAAKVGFDWAEAVEVLDKVREEVGELEAAMSGDGDIEAELGDLVFTIVNLARHLGVDPELSLQRANATFEARFRVMESAGSLADLTLDELNDRWEQAKQETH